MISYFLGNPTEALKLLLQNSPMAPKGKNELAKEATFNLVLKVSCVICIQ